LNVTNRTLAEIGAGGKPSIIVFNKTDAYTYIKKDEFDLTPKTRENVSLEELMDTWMAKRGEDCIFISAKEKQGIEELRKKLYLRVRELHVQKYPYNDFLYDTYEEGEGV
jgi:GTPase